MSVHAACQTIGADARPTRPAAASAQHRTAEAEDFRQLRHLTKNALQRVLSIISQDATLRSSRAGRMLSDDLQQRILTAAKLSDALFGFARHPGSLRDRLLSLSAGLVDLLGDDAATIRVAVQVRCGAATAHDDLLVRVAHELVGNAIKHGMHQRLLGDIQIEVEEDRGRIVLIVTDDGWGLGRETVKGQGLSIVDALLRPVDATYQLQRAGQRTVAKVSIPQNPGKIIRLQPAS